MIAPLALAASLVATPAGPARLERRLTLMGTEVEVEVEASSRPAAIAASEAAVSALEATEARLSTWRPDSDLARLNAAPAGEPVPVSPVLAAELDEAHRCWGETGGAFDPTVGALVEAWGLRTGGRSPSETELAAARAATGMDHLALGGGAAVRGLPGLRLEEGGFGKGAALRRALAALAADPRVDRASLNLGGQVAVLGEGTEWHLAVADPRRRERPAVALTIDRGSVATSGTATHGRHILDPRSGRPAADFGSLTVWTEDPLRADCLSTGLYVLGPEAALEWAAAHRGVEVLVLEPLGRRLVARVTAGLAEHLSALSPGVEIDVLPVEGPLRAAGR